MKDVRATRHALTRVVRGGAIAAAFLAACDNPAKPIPGAGDPENISRVTITLIGGRATQTSVRVDPDGTQLPQPVGAALGTLSLSKGVTYSGSIELLNDIDPKNVINITNEVKDEANFHRFFYTFVSCTGVSDPDPALFDKDTQNPPQ